ncbi:MAG: hypothetical protein IIW08_02260, partial [Clostridia bacterium]|nr:hypothetical protein [Clostridia bacterium]
MRRNARFYRVQPFVHVLFIYALKAVYDVTLVARHRDDGVFSLDAAFFDDVDELKKQLVGIRGNKRTAVFGTGGSVRVTTETNVAGIIVPAVAKLYRRITNPTLAIRRIGLSCNDVQEDREELQLNMFEDVTKQLRNKALQ